MIQIIEQLQFIFNNIMINWEEKINHTTDKTQKHVWNNFDNNKKSYSHSSIIGIIRLFYNLTSLGFEDGKILFKCHKKIHVFLVAFKQNFHIFKNP